MKRSLPLENYNRFKRNSAIAIACLVPILFPKVFASALTLLIVNPLASKMTVSFVSDAAILLLAFVIGAWFVVSKFKIRQHISWKPVLLLCYCSAYYALFRFEASDDFRAWNMTRLESLPSVAYLDILFFWPAILLLIHKKLPIKVETPLRDKNFAFKEDLHIATMKDDALGRKPLAEFLGDYILNSETQSSLSIGLNAGWGDGKTSFQKMVAEYIESKDSNVITIHFNPWKSFDEKRMIRDFFKIYSAAIKSYDFELADQIISYSKTLATLSESSIAKGLASLASADRNIEAEFFDINERLAIIGKKTVVFVDDIDRLSPAEIVELVKLIRNSASFVNTFFIVGFDGEYLREAIEKRSAYGKKNFFDKIFQIQFDLSAIPGSFIRTSLRELLERTLPEQASEISHHFEGKSTEADAISNVFFGTVIPSTFIPEILTNLRDVKRFSNFFSLNYKVVGTEVVFEDYLLSSLIRFKFPFFIKKVKRFKKGIFELDFASSRFTHKINLESLDKYFAECEIDAVDQEIIKRIFNYLFDLTVRKDRSIKSIVYPDKFDIYFDNSLNTRGLLFKEFVPLLRKEWPEIRVQVNEWLEAGKADNLAEMLFERHPEDIRDFEMANRIWVLIMNYPQQRDIHISRWLQRIQMDRGIIEKLYGPRGPEQFFKSLFSQHSPAFFSDNYALRFILISRTDYANKFFPMTREELLSTSLIRLRKFIRSRSEFDIRVFTLFYYHCIRDVDVSGKISLIELAGMEVRKYLQKYPIEYLRFVIRPKHGTAAKLYVFDPFIPEYFGSWEKFEIFLGDAVAQGADEFTTMLLHFENFSNSGYKEFESENPPIWLEKIDSNGLAYFKEQTYENLYQEVVKKQSIQQNPANINNEQGSMEGTA